MARSNLLLQSAPYAVKSTIATLGRNLRTARLRRNLTIQEVAAKIGTGVRAIRDAENGKVSASIGVYVALLWVYDLLDQAEKLADPAHDDIGLRLEKLRAPQRARSTKGKLSNDF